ncbi:MAG: beta-propeller domain-containing protein [Bacillota bacterium]|nr:beta-propeller domain-containing protein [Bacillota bacterium]
MSNNMNDFDFIKDKFDHDGIKAPASLDPDAILPDGGVPKRQDMPKRPLRKRRWFRPAVAIAACAALAIGIIPMTRAGSGGPVTADDLLTYSSYQELSQAIEDMAGPYMVDGPVSVQDFDVMDSAAPAAPKESASSALSSGESQSESISENSSEDHSETYTQEADVDEADIVKTDGRYIYFVSGIENQIIIAKASKGSAERVAAISASKAGSYIEDMYLHDGQLIVIAEDDRIAGRLSSDYRRVTRVTTFDVTDPENPEKLNQYAQTGGLLSSRMIQDTVCLVTNDYIYSHKKRDCVPYLCYGSGDPELMPVGDIRGIPHATSSAYTVIGCFDTSTGTADRDSIRTKAVLGGSEEIYCSSKNLYITSGIYDEKADEDLTCVLKVSLKNGKARFQQMAKVPGYVNNQFSMGEGGGTFKIATTDYVNDHDVNNLFLFDENMREIGSVRNFARDEHIEAVRYIGSKAYVITYEETDPLFIIDLSDPEDPVIAGHVKITGFSTLLVPADKDHLLGFGFSTEDTEFGEATDGLKLALFDISDPSSPEVADSQAFAGMESELQYNHKALLVGPDSAYYALPYSVWSDKNGYGKNGILMFSAKGGKLSDASRLQTKEAVNRCIYIGDYLYGICSDDSIEGFNIQ